MSLHFYIDGLGIVTIISRNRVVKIPRGVNGIFLPQPLHELVFHPPRTGVTRRLENKALSLKQVFKAQRITPLSLSVVRTI